ncbi:SspB family protein [Cognatiyoonia sp. IB215182]|uniref:SspB family protein n=1 Tax=Cognatiyoonia sp. IB215182 TaxID=3097353 RepID=UPI002A0DBBEE|nr:ClpXP protease specificity-enhancing factor SspB [Cognatiyoonia sp. IB215182]MDX8353520.1 ClpXP protease specificity-enhancing factor SspB [Cognatiyoonia sp. IB215182]
MTSTIDYGNLMHRAMRGLIQEVLTRIEKDGLPGAHHFFITFDTMHPDVEIADWLSDRYPGEMTVVIQHWFDNLNVTDEGFTITLNFGDNPETLYIPYDAIKTFVDPSVEFGLRFETQEDEDAAIVEIDEAPMEEMVEPEETAPQERKEADVVSLDQFRK